MLLCGAQYLDDIGLVVMDPQDRFAALATKPISGRIERIRISDGRALVVVDGVLHAYAVSGNAFEDMAPPKVSGSILDIQPRAGGFLRWTGRAL